MQGIRGQNAISILLGSSSAGTNAAPSDSVASCFVNSFSRACNTVINRSTVHDTHSSPWHNERRGDHYLSKYSSPTSSKAGKNITKKLLKAEYKKNAGESRDNLSSYRGMLNNTNEKYREYSYDKPNYLSREYSYDKPNYLSR